MTIEKIPFEFSDSIQTVDGTSKTAIEMVGKVITKTNECVELVNGVSQIAAEATAIVDEMATTQQDFLTNVADSNAQVVTNNQTFIDDLNASKTTFENDLNTSKTTFENNMTAAVNTIVANSETIIQTDVTTKIDALITDGTIEGLIDAGILTDVRGDIVDLETSVVNIKNAYVPYVSVKDPMFGAVGDGVTDDSAAFTAWLAYVIEHDRTGFIPDGVYHIATGGITYRQPVNNHKWRIEGQSKLGTILKFDYHDLNHIDLRYCSNFSLENFTIQCSGLSPQAGANGLYLVKPQNAAIKHIEITNCSRGGVLVYADDYLTGGVCDNLYFDDVNIHGVPNSATHPEDGKYHYPMGWILSDCINTTVNNSTIRNILWYGFEFKNYCYNSYFMNCNAYDSVTACHIGGELREGDSYGVHDCGFINITCYNVDTVITGGAYYNVVFQNIVGFYPDDWQAVNPNYAQHSIRPANCYNSIATVSLFNVPIGGVRLSNAQNFKCTFEAITLSPTFTGRYYIIDNDGLNANNIIECKYHPLAIDFVYRYAERNLNNLIIDHMKGHKYDGRTNAKQYDMFDNVPSPNSLTINKSAAVLVESYYSGDGVPKQVFGDNSSTDNIAIYYDIPNNQIQFRFKDEGVTKIAYLKPTGFVPAT